MIHSRNWQPRSLSWILCLALGASLLVFAVIGLLAPELASRIYGVPLSNDPGETFYQAKAIRDLVMAAFLLTAVFRRAQHLGLYICAWGIPISACDASIVYRTYPDNWMQMLILHGGTIAALVVTVLLLRRELQTHAKPTVSRPIPNARRENNHP